MSPHYPIQEGRSMRVSELLDEPEQLPIRLHGGLGEVVIDKRSTALLIVDMNEHIARPYQGPKALAARELGLEAELEYFWERVRLCLRNLQALRQAFRDASMEVIYITGAPKLSLDDRDRGPGPRLLHSGGYYRTASGEILPNPNPSPIVPELEPAPNEIVIGKRGAGPFGTTNIDHVLHHLGITTLVVAGLITNQCVEATIRGAFDFGFIPILVEDATGTYSEDLQHGTLKSIGDWFCAVRTTEEVLAEVAALARQPEATPV